MKNLSIICVFFCILTISCEKNITEILENSVQESTLSSSEPLEYASVEELINAIYSQNIDVRSSDFVSYAETVMQEDGYDDLPWAINSVNFASILNSEGEVIFDDVFLKLCRYGIIYAPVTKIDNARNYALYDECTDLVQMTASIPSYLSDADCTFSFINDSDIYVYDTFGIISGTDTNALDTKVLAPEMVDYKEYRFDQEDILVKDNKIKWKRDFNVANGSAQKNNFTSKICNDTRIFQDNYGVYSESGVVTKTMKKNVLGIWSKFENQVNAGIIDLVLCEEGVIIRRATVLPDHPYNNFMDINKFKIDIAGELANRELILATVTNYTESAVLNMTNGQYETLKENILNWARQKGVSITKLHGIRFYNDVNDRCYIRLDNEEFSGVEKDMRVLVNYFWGGAQINGHDSLLGSGITGGTDIDGKTHPYHVQKVTMYGSSEYGGEERGSRLFYNYNHNKHFN